MKKMAILTISPEVLRNLLQLPECDVIRVENAPGYRGVLQLVIEGAGWDTPEGGAIMPAEAAICTSTVDPDGAVRTSIDWRLPTSEADSSIKMPFIWGRPVLEQAQR